MADFDTTDSTARRGWVFYLIVAGFIVVGLFFFIGGWIVPATVKSIDPLLLKKAAQNSPTIVDAGLKMVGADRVGPAQIVLAAAAKHPAANSLASAINEYTRRRPELVPWGGYDPHLEQVFNLRDSALAATNQPIIPILIPEANRSTVARFLTASRSSAVSAILDTRSITNFSQFAPALGPGGQPLDATILMTALLVHSDHLHSELAAELKNLVETARANPSKRQALEIFYLDLLSAGKRLNWIQLAELMKLSPDTRTVHFFTEQAKTASESFASLYTAAIVSRHPEKIASLVGRFGRSSALDIAATLETGTEALDVLLARQVPIRAGQVRTFDPFVSFSLGFPKLALILKYLFLLTGVWMIVHGITMLFPPVIGAVSAPSMPLARNAIVTLGVGVLLILASEPYLLTKGPKPDVQLEVLVPGGVQPAAAPVSKPTTPKPAMDITTIFSIVLFLLIQVFVYIVCLMKLNEIDGQQLPALLKLRLVENEENLFDTGLYVGIGGTAAALVLQVLGVIEANLLAAYSSNLLGIIGVALVKIRHVRPFKRKLIIEASTQSEIGAAAPAPVPASSLAIT